MLVKRCPCACYGCRGREENAPTLFALLTARCLSPCDLSKDHWEEHLTSFQEKACGRAGIERQRQNEEKIEPLHALDVLDLTRAHTYRDTRLHGRILNIPALGLECLKDHHLGVAVDNTRAHAVVIGDLVLIVTGPAQTVAEDGGVKVVGVCDGIEPGHQRVVDGALALLDGDANGEAGAPLPDAHVVVIRIERVAVRTPRLEVHDVAVAAKVGRAAIVAVLGRHVATAVEQDGLAAGDLGGGQNDVVLEPLAEDNGGALAVEGAHLDGAHAAVVG